MLGISNGCELECQFERFKDKYNISYSSDAEETYRKEIFSKNLDRINEFNNNNKSTHKLGINRFSDKFENEKILNKVFKKSHKSRSCDPQVYDETYQVPLQINWVDKGAVTNVKDQGQCGSCWAFSTTGAIEGALKISKQELVSISEQQLIDCSLKYGDFGCNGGMPDNGFEYVIDNGICTEDEYQYHAKKSSCDTSNCVSLLSVSSCVDVIPYNEMALEYAVSKQPISVAIQADTFIFQHYKTGIITDVECGTDLDHAVLVVGYGVENGLDYWLVKNSWGETWGDNGYVKILKSNSTNDAGICGIASVPSYPVV
jgi:cathepsin L